MENLKDGKLVKLIKSQTNLRSSVFLEKYNLSLFNHGRYPFNRYRVWQGSQIHGDRRLLGQVFCVNHIWVFAPNTYGKVSKPETWFFGNTRTDAISGYFQSIGQEVTEQ